MLSGDLAQGADVDLFYYAGHGVQVRGKNFLAPVEASLTKEADIYVQLVDAEAVLSQMEGSGARLNLVILDACRNNPFGAGSLRALGGGLAQMEAPQGTLISYATQPGNVAQDGPDGDSPYTKALAQRPQGDRGSRPAATGPPRTATGPATPPGVSARRATTRSRHRRSRQSAPR